MKDPMLANAKINKIRTIKQVQKYIDDNYTVEEFNTNKQLKTLYGFLIDNKKLSIADVDKKTAHLINKYCWLYTIAEMIAILQKKEGIKMDLICSSLVQKLKTEQARGNVMLVTYSKKIKSQIYKYL